MKRIQSAPDLERLSVVMAVILLAYVSVRFVSIPTQSFTIDFAGLFLPLQFNLNSLVSILVAALAAAGVDWLFQDENFQQDNRAQHWLLPALTAWIIGLPLANLPLSPLWWLVFIGGGMLLSLIFIAEFISANPKHKYFTLVSTSLGAISFALFLMLAISLRALNLRLILSLPSLFIAAAVISIRIQILRLSFNWTFPPIAAVSFFTMQIAAALHYWPLSALAYGILLLASLFAANSFFTSIAQGMSLREALKEPLFAIGAFSLLAFLMP